MMMSFFYLQFETIQFPVFFGNLSENFKNIAIKLYVNAQSFQINP